MRPIDGATIRDRRRRRSGAVPKFPREVVPVDPESTLPELCLFAHLALDAVLFRDHRGWEPLIVGGQFQFGVVVLFGGSDDNGSEGGRGVGDGGVGTFVEEGVGHLDSPRGLRRGERRLEEASYERRNRLRAEEREVGAAATGFYFALLFMHEAYEDRRPKNCLAPLSEPEHWRRIQ